MLATMKERLAYFSKERDFFFTDFVRKIKEQLFSAFFMQVCCGLQSGAQICRRLCIGSTSSIFTSFFHQYRVILGLFGDLSKKIIEISQLFCDFILHFD